MVERTVNSLSPARASEKTDRIVTYEKPVILSDGKLSIGEASASFEGADLLAIETLPITDARLRTAWDHDLYRIRLKGNDAGFRLTIQ